MARSFYCGEHDTVDSDSMNIMMGRGMMWSGFSNNTSVYMWLFWIIVTVALVLLIIYLIKQLNKN